jgi:hypothetical protein
MSGLNCSVHARGKGGGSGLEGMRCEKVERVSTEFEAYGPSPRTGKGEGGERGRGLAIQGTSGTTDMPNTVGGRWREISFKRWGKSHLLKWFSGSPRPRRFPVGPMY